MRQQALLDATVQIHPAIEFGGIERPELDRFLIREDSCRQQPEVCNVRVVAEHFLAVLGAEHRHLVSLLMQVRRRAGRPQRIAIAAHADYPGPFIGARSLPRLRLPGTRFALAQHEQEAVFVALAARLRFEQRPVAKRQAEKVDQRFRLEVVLVIRVRSGLADARIEIRVRQVKHQVSADLEQSPPLAQRPLPVFDVLQKVAAEYVFCRSVGEDRHLRGIWDDQIGPHLHAEQRLVPRVVDADQVRPDLVRTAADVEPTLGQERQDLVSDFPGFVALRGSRIPDHAVFRVNPAPSIGAGLRGSKSAGQQVFDLRECPGLAHAEVGKLVDRDLDLAGVRLGVGIDRDVGGAEEPQHRH